MMGVWSDAATWSPWVLMIMAISATYIWRFMGAAIAAKIDPESDLLLWVTCVAYGLLAGLIGRILVFPVGILEETEVHERLGATALGIVLFLVFKRNIAVGTLSAAACLMVFVWMRLEGVLVL